MNKYSYIFLVFLILGLFSCRKTKDLTSPTVENVEYYPLKVGNYSIYQVQKSNYGLTGRTDTSFQLKNVFQESWTDLEGDASVKIARYKKGENAISFVLDSIWHAKTKSSQVIVTENNVPFLKLHMPLSEGKVWNGNLFNSSEAQNYKVSNLATPWGEFANTVTIVQQNVSNRLYREYIAEIYAKDIGLVYRELQNVKLEFSTGRITEGTVVKQTLTSYGKE